MPKGIPKKRYTPEFKKLVVETMQKEKLSYRIWLAWTEKDTANSENVGISSFYIINQEDDINLFAEYCGDAKETPGINIGIQNTWPDHLSYFEDDEEDDE